MRHSRGFTLLEILIALFIFSIVSMIMVSALHTVFTSQSNTARHADALSKLQIVYLLMSRDFEQTMNRPITNAKNIVDPSFVGTTDTVTFTHGGLSNPMNMMQRSTLQRTQYSLNNERLMRSIWPVLDQTQKTLPSNRIILKSVTALRFDYLDAKGQFQNNWPPADQKEAIFPRAVRVTLTLKNWGTFSQLYLIPQTPQKTAEKKPGEPSNTTTPDQKSGPSQPTPPGQPPSANKP